MDATSVAILITAIGGLITGLMAQLGARRAQKQDHWIDQNKQLFSNVDQVVQSLRDELDRVNEARREDQRVARAEIAVREREISRLRDLCQSHGIVVDNLGAEDDTGTNHDQG